MKPIYPINYTPSFVVFWGIAFLLEAYYCGILGIAFTATALLIVFTHEHAHASECVSRGVPIIGISFTWLGGMVLADIEKPMDKIAFYKAGIVDTFGYAIGFLEIMIFVEILHNVIRPIGVNFANSPYINFVSSLALFAGVLFIVNILPISFYSKKHDVQISTDGWAAFKLWKASCRE